ncbi:E3 ubiquitin-protein ligase RNF135 [Dromaius novaehollandiae]|uniref:E3 ubiquitin-protein ligase RNF135-like n=1 Tax=Dromaius novaehollandiae TaxID=8790 RepID=A0A8C4K072_DRONO|nr:E3 ubiquitin-protein ligase RNF135-like [Dromaius novaehollandiae]
MAASLDLRQLQAHLDLKCPCCLLYFTDPVRLAVCSHSFCRSCITAYCKTKRSASCPLCREAFELKDLRPNRELAVLVNLIPREEKEKDLERWDVLGLDGAGASARGSPSSAGRRDAEKEKAISEISKQLEMTEETIRLLRKDLSKTKEYTSQIKSQITKDFCCMKEYIERQERNTLMFIEQQQQATQQKIEETIDQLCAEVNKLTGIKAQLEEGLGYLPERDGYKGSPLIMDKITLDEEKINFVTNAVEDLKKQLEMLLLEKYPGRFPTEQLPDLHQETRVCSLSSESAAKNPEPGISSQFSQWAEDVTFDLTRIYQRLVITDQNRKVMVSHCPCDYVPSPKRFCISQVMCSQSFSTGCHYWEIITKDSDGWAVGVAHEMIGRREKLGRSEHSWCVEWVGPKKQLSAWHKDQETLLNREKPLKVGVFLELQKQCVSFYSITDKEMLLHTFKINTSNPLYPAFWLYSLDRNGSLTISHTSRR